MRNDILRNLRINKGMTQDQMAEMFKINRTTYGKWENGKHIPDTTTLTKLADFFNVTVDYLLGTGNKERITDAVSDDIELMEFWNTLKERPDLQLMFKQTKDLKESDIKQIIKIIKAFEDEEASIGD